MSGFFSRSALFDLANFVEIRVEFKVLVQLKIIYIVGHLEKLGRRCGLDR